jgi:hypothetical protein
MTGFFFLEDTLTPLLAGVAIDQEVEEELKNQAPDVLEYAQSNAPWNDITGDARRGLGVDVYTDHTVVILELYHTVDYGLWLEVIEEGKWATIMPTLEHFSSEIRGSVGATETGVSLGGDE